MEVHNMSVFNNGVPALFTPTQDYHPAEKHYVDGEIATLAASVGETNGTFNLTLTGAFTNPTPLVCKYRKVGNVVYLTGANATAAQSNISDVTSGFGEVPAAIRPAVGSTVHYIYAVDNGTVKAIEMGINFQGSAYFEVINTSNFSGGGNLSILDFNVAYNILN